MVSGTRPCSIAMSKTSSAAGAPALPAAIANSANADLLATRRHTVLSPRPLSAGARLDIRDAIEHPAGIVRGGEQRGIADRRPQNPAKRVAEPGDRVPGRLGSCIDAKRQPAVPRKVL